MPDVLRPFRRADQWVRSLPRMKYALVMTGVILVPLVFANTVIDGDAMDTWLITLYGVGFLVVNYAAYSWKAGDWSLPTSWPEDRK